MPELLGKNVTLTAGGPRSSYRELEQLLSDLNVRDCLRSFGDLFDQLDEVKSKAVTIEGVIVPSFAIPPLALELILASDDTRTGQLDHPKLASIVNCFHNLPTPSADGDGSLETLLRMGQSQLSFQAEDPYRLARYARVLRDTWPKVPQAAPMDVQQATHKSFGVGLDETLLLGFAFAGQGRKGYVTRYEDESGKATLASLFTRDNQDRFLRALAITYGEIRNSVNGAVPDQLRTYRFNPLVLTPLVIPDQPPPDLDEEVYLLPCPKFLLDRITCGLVYDLRKAFGRSFNDAFGYVVERYAGDLLTDAYGNQVVRGEFNYRVNKSKHLSPDWFVVDRNRAVVIEVKKALLHSSARSFCALEQVRVDLQGTLQKAVAQLVKFSRHQRDIRDFPPRMDTEYVVVIWDDTWWANSILLDEVSGIPDDMHIHVISIRDLERMLSRCPEPKDLYELLWAKRHSGGSGPKMDMGDWLSRLPGGTDFTPLTSLTRTQEEFFGRWNIEMPQTAPV